MPGGGLFLPAKTPREIVAVIHRDMIRVLGDITIRNRLTGLRIEPVGNTPEEFSAQIAAEIPYWAKVIKSAGITLQ